MTKIWLSSRDIQMVMGCKATKAAEHIKKCNAMVKQKRPDAIMPGRGKTYVKAFCQLTGITRQELSEALEGVKA